LSTNFGIIVCIECSGIHREMGVHISKIQSLTLDNIGTSQLLVSRLMSNEQFNKVMEACAVNKLNPNSTM
jgi:Arf-GAP/SH3 domain/ANK repeat/PH domain-containing protein